MCFFVKVYFVFCVFCVSLDDFGFVLSKLFLLSLVFSAPSQEIGWKERLRNDLFYVEWGVKTCSILNTLNEYVCTLAPRHIHFQNITAIIYSLTANRPT